MRFQVPQFIEIEDQVIGPLTIKQFIYLAGGAGICYVTYAYVPFILLAIPLIAVEGALALALAFYKVNNKPFIDMLEASIKFYFGEKLYIWKKEPKKIVPLEDKPAETPQVYVPKLSDSKLKELSWSLDINENMNPVTKNNEAN